MKKAILRAFWLIGILMILVACGSNDNGNYINESDNYEESNHTPTPDTPAPTPPVDISGDQQPLPQETILDNRVNVGFFGERAFVFFDLITEAGQSLPHLGEGFFVEPSYFDTANISELLDRLRLERSDAQMINAFVATFSDFSLLPEIGNLYLGIILYEPTNEFDDYVGLFLRSSLAMSQHSRPLIATGLQGNVDIDNISLLVDDTTLIQRAIRTALEDSNVGHVQIPENSSRIVRHASMWLSRGQIGEIRFVYASADLSVVTGEDVTLSVEVEVLRGDVGDITVHWYDKNGQLLGTGETLSICTETAGEFYFSVWAFNTIDGDETSASTRISVSINTWDAGQPYITTLALNVAANFTIYAASGYADLSFITYISDIGTHRVTLVVEAKSPDGGTLSYQWYQVQNGVATQIRNATSNSLMVEVDAEGQNHYYVVITNTNLAASGNQTAFITSSSITITLKAEVPPPYLPPFDIFFNGRSRTFDFIDIDMAGTELGGDQRARLEMFVNEYILDNPRVDHIRVDGRFWYYEPGVIEGGISLARAMLVTEEMRRLGVEVPIHPTANFEQFYSGWLQRRTRITVALTDE